MFTDFVTLKPIFDAVRLVGGPLSQRDVFAINGAIDEARRRGSDQPIFDVARILDDDNDGLSTLEVDIINRHLAAARAGQPVAIPAIRGKTTGSAGLSVIEQFEGCVLTAYLCPAKVWTIGYGHTGSDVHPGLTITKQKAEELLARDLALFENALNRLAPTSTQNQFDAMISLMFNIGIGAFEKSSVLRWHRSGRYDDARKAFGLFIYGGGRVLPGLVRRREAEAELYGRK